MYELYEKFEAGSSSSTAETSQHILGPVVPGLGELLSTKEDVLTAMYNVFNGFQSVSFELSPADAAVTNHLELVPVVGSFEKFVKQMHCRLAQTSRSYVLDTKMLCLNSRIAAVCDAIPTLEETIHKPAIEIDANELCGEYSYRKTAVYKHQYEAIMRWDDFPTEVILSVIGRRPRIPDEAYPKSKKYVKRNVKQFW